MHSCYIFLTVILKYISHQLHQDFANNKASVSELVMNSMSSEHNICHMSTILPPNQLNVFKTETGP